MEDGAVKNQAIISAFLAVITWTGQTEAQLGFGARVGTLGLGGDVVYGFSEKVAVRGSLSGFPIRPSGTISDVDYRIRMPGPMFGAGLDYYVAGPLRLTGGVLTGIQKTAFTADYRGSFTGNVRIGDNTYTPAEIGQLSGRF